MVLRAQFAKRNAATGELLRREILYVSSLSANFVHNFHDWYSSHISAILNNLESLTNRDSDLELDGIEALVLKFTLLPNLSGRGFFQLPDKLKRM